MAKVRNTANRRGKEDGKSAALKLAEDIKRSPLAAAAIAGGAAAAAAGAVLGARALARRNGARAGKPVNQVLAAAITATEAAAACQQTQEPTTDRKPDAGKVSFARPVFRKLDELPEPQRDRMRNLLEQVRQALHESGVIEGQGVGPLVDLDSGRAAVGRLATDDLSIDWAQSKLLGAPQMAKELGISPATLANWRREGRVVAFKRDLRNYHYPGRQIYRGTVIEGLCDIVRRFDHVEDGWEWLVTPNSQTQGLPPIDRLRLGAREEVKRAAEGALDFA
jgi:hypothetical protein